MSQHPEDLNKIRVGITIGDMNGVGPEVVIKTFSDATMLQLCTPVIYGSGKVLSYYRKTLKIDDFNYNTIKSANEINLRKINLINCWQEEADIKMGIADPASGKFAFTSLQKACEDLGNNQIDVLVTAPIDKKTMQQEGFRFPGHTEYLSQQFKSSGYLMMLVSDNLRVATVTGHIPLSEVPGALNKELIVQKINIMNASLKCDFGIRKPKIAVLGLNPHSGDNGLLGSEEQEFIIPAVKESFDKGIIVYGPYSADGFFGASLYKTFDGVLAMYHDQGLIPFKSVSFGAGVNFTAGLPVVRTSPDHGTGYDIAGKGLASESSFRHAVFLACDIVRKRREYDELIADPLKFSKGSKDR
jgi:4-hydroxythreonine-4-phosphate dehydrogenase